MTRWTAVACTALTTASLTSIALPTARAAPSCAATRAPAQAERMAAYARSGPIPARQDGTASVTVDLPPIAFDGSGRSPTLPVGPCQHIYRFAFPAVQATPPARPRPFRYVEVDWNTEGMPRGPNGAFVSPHFDFHFYVRTRRWVDANTRCPSSNGRTCDPTRTPYRQMRRFLALPPAPFLPPSYRPDPDSSIPMMGLHLLDTRFRYTTAFVDHHPVRLYGTFDGAVLFAEASVTLATLQDVARAPGQVASFAFRSPARVRGGAPWPRRLVIRHLPATGGFRVGFTRLG